MTVETRCHARQYGDQTYCATCRLTWDTNDPDPPACGKGTRVVVAPERVEPKRLEFATGQPFSSVTRANYR